MLLALEWHSGMWLRVLPLHKVPGSLVTETVNGTKLSEGKLCHLHPFQPEVCAVVVIRPKELKEWAQHSTPSKVTEYFGYGDGCPLLTSPFD